MPRPIEILGTEKIDPTLPQQIKPSLYYHDEYQLYDLVGLQVQTIAIGNEIGYSLDGRTAVIGWGYGDTGIGPTFDILSPLGLRVEAGTMIPSAATQPFYNNLPDSDLPAILPMPLFYASTVIPDETRIITIPDTAEYSRIKIGTVGGGTKFLLQRFSVFDYPWAETYSQKLSDFYNSACNVFITSYAALVFFGTNADSIRYYQYRQDPTLRKTPNLFFANIVGLNFQYEYEINSSVDCDVVITYFYEDGESRGIKCYSKGYRRLNITKGINRFKVSFPAILPCSIVLSSSNGGESVLSQIRAQLLEAEVNEFEYLFFDQFDSYTNTITAEAEQAQTNNDFFWFTYQVDFSGKGGVIFANNNYWQNNQNALSDISPESLKVLVQRNDLSFSEITLNEIDNEYYVKHSDGSYGLDMPDSVRIQEIHAALEAQKFAVDERTGNERIANIGYYVERIARVLGISVYPNGQVKSIRPKKRISDGSLVPAGWYFGQFGTNAGGQTEGQEGGNAGEIRDGIVYEHKSNKLIPDKYNPEDSKIEQGDLVLCENWIQFFDEYMDDLDKALAWQEIGANGIPSADGSGKVLLYEGLGALVAECTYMLSRISQHTSQNLIATKVNQGISQEILAALGLPISDKAFYERDSREGEDLAVPYPAVLDGTPTIAQQIGWILQNLGILVASQVVYDESIGDTKDRK